MGDRVDEIVSDYITGMLEAKINSLEKTRRKEEKKEEKALDYQKLSAQKEVLDASMASIDGLLIKQILIARFKYHLTWVNVGKRVSVEESTARKQYAKYKKQLRKNFKGVFFEE